jgi:WhiB family redox-sensing transcriptional regulator
MSKHNPQILNLRPVYDEWAWQEQSNCKNVDSDLFFLEPLLRGKQKREKERKAKAICKGCPVVNECLRHAMKTPEYFGVWGGMTADERLKILEKRLS